MTHYSPELKMYAKNGLRSAEEWTSLGREVQSQAKPRAEVDFRGVVVPLFTRDQTHLKARRQPA
jgi:hypothetical protein